MKTIDVAGAYYAAFSTDSPGFDEVPMTDDLVFRSPMMTLEGPEAFRQALSGLMAGFKAMETKVQLCEGDTVVTVYDFDMGLPGGPVPMAEVVRVRDGAIAEVDLLFDSKRLSPG